MLRSDWKELSERFGQNRRKDRQELAKYKEDWERLKSLLPPPGKVMNISEFLELLKAIRELVGK